MVAVPSPARGPSEEREAELRRLWAEGATLREIGETLGVSHERARQLLADLELSVQGRSNRRKAYVASRFGEEIETLFYTQRDDASVAEALGLESADVREIVDQRVPDAKLLRRRPTAHQRRYSADDLRELLVQAASANPSPLSHDAYNEWAAGRQFPDGRPYPTYQTAMLRWKSWRGALVAAGLPAGARLGPVSTLTADQCVSAIVQCWKDLGHWPVVRDYDQWSPHHSDAPSSASIRKLFDGWSDVLLSAWEVRYDQRIPRTDRDVVDGSEVDSALDTVEDGDGATALEDVAVAYRIADETIDPTPAQLAAPDTGAVRRALRTHAWLQNQAAALVRSTGARPLSPKAVRMNFDLAWRDDNGVAVCEVKSVPPGELETAMRGGFAQALRYRSLLTAHLAEPVRAVLFVEQKPDDEWLALCDEVRLLVVWPDTLSHLTTPPTMRDDDAT